MAIVATLHSIGELVKRTREAHQIKIETISLIRDIENRPKSDPPSSADTANFNCTEGRDILDAVAQYSGDLPLGQLVKVVGMAGDSVLLDTIDTEWDSIEFKIDRIQYPLDSQRETLMDSKHYRQTIDGATNRPLLQFMDSTPTGPFVIWYFRPHVFDIGKNVMSIPPHHWEAVSSLAASKIVDKAATKASGFSDRPGGFDSKDQGSLGERLARRAERLEKKYNDLIAADTPPYQPTWVNWDVDSPLGPRIVSLAYGL